MKMRHMYYAHELRIIGRDKIIAKRREAKHVTREKYNINENI